MAEAGRPFDTTGVGLRIENRRGDRIRSFADWERLAGPAGGERQWKEGRSAFEAARAWCGGGSPAVPDDLLALLESGTLGAFVPAMAVPEKKTHFEDGRFGPRNHDVVVYGRCDGRPTVVCVEAKADEGLDRPVRDRLEGALKQRRAGERTVFPERVEMLAQAILGRSVLVGDEIDPVVGGVPYQLLSGVGGTLREAHLCGAEQAAFVVHVLDAGGLDCARKARNEEGVVSFLRLLGVDAPAPGTLYGPLRLPGHSSLAAVPLHLGWTTSRVRS